ncbi:hypothetical protein A33M_4213 [Rhodovulum sp. PH10]|nr:hypothetical protein A33M_4213 [Rhodovulum sp. PH10]
MTGDDRGPSENNHEKSPREAGFFYRSAVRFRSFRFGAIR